MADPVPVPDAPAPQPAPFSYDLAAARAGAAKAGLAPGAADAQINSYLAPLRGYNLAAALAGATKAGVSPDAANAQIAEFLAPPPPPIPQTSATGAFVHAAGEGALPATGGMAAAGLGAEMGAGLGAMIPGAGETGIPEVVGGLAGGLTGYFGGAAAVEKAQQAVIAALPASVQHAIGEAPEQVQARATQHPYATMLGGLAPNLAFMLPGAVEKAAADAPAIVKFMANPIAARGFGAGTNAALEAVQEHNQGQGYDPVKLGIALGAGALMNRETALGRGVSGAGAAVAGGVGDFLSPRPGAPPPATPEAAAAEVLAAPNVDDSIAAAEDLAQRQTPIDVGKVAGDLDTGEPGDQQQAKLLRMFSNLGSGTVEHDGSGGYQFRTTGPDGADITHPIAAWDPDAAPSWSAGATVPPETAHAISDHYAALGVHTVFYQNDPAIPFGGAVDPRQPDTMFLSNNPDEATAQVAGHEFTHVLATTTLPDGTSLGDLLNRQIAASITPEGQRYAAATFGQTAPARSAFPEGAEGDAPHAAAVQAHLVNELGADIGAEAPKFQTFLPQVVDAVQRRFGNSVAADVLGKLITGLRTALDTVRRLFGNTATESQNWVTNLGDIHDTLAQMYAERFGSPVEREQAALVAMRDHAARDAFVAAPQGPQEGVSEVAPAADEPGAADALTGKAVTLRRWAGELSAGQKTAAADSPQVRMLQQTEAAILRTAGGPEGALPPPAAARLEAVRSQLAAATNPPDSPALAAVKSELDTTVAAAKAVRRGPSPYAKVSREPKRLLQFLRESNTVGSGLNAETIPGGIVDQGGDVAQIIGGPEGRPGLINNATGRPLDAQTERAWEAGYFPEHTERPEINDLLAAIRDDHTGTPRYSVYDQDEAASYQNAIAHNTEIDRIASEIGIDPAGMTYDEFFDAATDHGSAPSPEDVAVQDNAAYAEFADMVPGHDAGEPRSMEDAEDEYRQAEAAGALDRDEEGDAGRGPFPGGEGAGEEGAGPGLRGAGAGRGAEAEDAALDHGPALSPSREETDPAVADLAAGAQRTAAISAAFRRMSSEDRARLVTLNQDAEGIFETLRDRAPDAATYARLNEIHDERSGLLAKYGVGESASARPPPGVAFSPRITGADRETEAYTPDQIAAYTNVGRITDEPSWRDRMVAATKDIKRRTLRYMLDPYIGVKASDPAGYMALRNANTSSGAVEMFLTDGTLKFNGSAYAMGDRNGGVQHLLIRPLHGEQDRFIWWRAANRAQRLAKEDRENLFSAGDIAALKSTNQGQTAFDYTLPNGTVTRSREAIYLDSNRKMDIFDHNVLDIEAEAGLISAHTVGQLVKNSFYVPYYRIAEGDTHFAGPQISSGFVKQSAFKKLTGGVEKLNHDLWENAIGNWSHGIDASIRNRAARTVLDTSVANGSAVERTAQEVEQQMTKRQKQSVVWSMKNGEKQYFEITDPMLHGAITALDFSGYRNPIMNAASKFKTLLTLGVTADPRFMLRVSIRDAEQAIATAPMSYNMVGNVIDGFRMGDLPGALQNVARAVAGRELERLNLGQNAADAIAGGGTMRLGSGHEGGMRKTDLATMLDSPNAIQAFWGRISTIARAYKEVSAQGEDVQRFALYNKLIGEGVPHDAASFAARDLEDFTLRGAGTIVRGLTQTVPFMNAWAQGLYKVGRSAMDADRNIGVAVGMRVAASATRRVATVLGATTLLTLALDSIYQDDPDYKKRAEYDRNSNFWFKFGGVQFRIPMGFEIAAMSRIAANGVEAFLGTSEMTPRRFLNNVGSILGTNMSMNPTPQIISPLLDVWENESGTGTPIVPMGLQGLQSQEQYNAGSTLLARGISSVGSSVVRTVAGPQHQFLSPIQIDYLVNGYFGWLGSMVTGTADRFARNFADVPARPAMDLWNFATGGMVSTQSSPQSRYVDLLYQQAAGINRAFNTYHYLLNTGQQANAAQFYSNNRELIVKHGLVADASRFEGEENRQALRVENDPDMTPEQKRVAILQINAARNRVVEPIFGGRNTP